MTSGYFESPLPVRLVLASFFLLTLPLTALSLFAPTRLEASHLTMLYFILIGGTHFCLTFALYFRSENLRHFRNGWINQLIYFAIPLAIFASFSLYRVFSVAVVYPAFDGWFVGTVRFFNFFHWGRQSFGMTQLYHKRSGAAFPTWMRHTQNGHFTLLVLLMMATFLGGGRFSTSSFLTIALIVLAVANLGVTLYGYWLVRKADHAQGSFFSILAYFALQTVSGFFAIYSTVLFTFALAMHYIEYHVVMYPRVFHAPLGDSWIDRIFGVLRGNRFIFYILLVNVAVISGLFIATAGHATARSWSLETRIALSLFDGLFVCHYFIEAFVWKLGQPFYRQTVLPLYFASKKKVQLEPQTSQNDEFSAAGRLEIYG